MLAGRQLDRLEISVAWLNHITDSRGTRVCSVGRNSYQCSCRGIVVRDLDRATHDVGRYPTLNSNPIRDLKAAPQTDLSGTLRAAKSEDVSPCLPDASGY